MQKTLKYKTLNFKIKINTKPVLTQMQALNQYEDEPTKTTITNLT